MSERKGEWKLPKNVRQIGEIGGGKIIYVEDYVITFLEGIALKEQKKKAILLGSVRYDEEKCYIFVDGALETDGFDLNDQEKEDLLEKMEKYFKEKSVVGWFLSSEESPFVMKREIADIFQREFPGKEQVLIVRDAQEEETAVFLMEEEYPAQQPGYYIYYEKNVPMQEYMIVRSGGKSVEEEQPVKDDAIKRFRKIIKKKNEKKEEQEKKKWKIPSVGRLSYLVGGGLTVTILALGVTMIYNYDRMEAVERNLAMLTNNIDSQEQYLGENGTAQVMLHLEQEINDNMTETEEETQQTEEPVMQQGEGLLNLETELLHSQEQKEEAAETLQGKNTSESEKTETTESAETESVQETAVVPTTAGRASYTVKAGDTLAGISEMYYGNMEKVEEICMLNGIDDENTILPGQKILLP
ncbi:MAG: LysM domain-containing protein [Eubacteriales bacterium]|nr:LysM domain-containing protein [Eubacteriales bacterium]